MPVSTGAPETSNGRSAKRCKHCEESGHRVDSGNLFWRIQLDQDLLDTIVAIYPEWFKDYNLGRAVPPGMADGVTRPNNTTEVPGNSSAQQGLQQPLSPSTKDEALEEATLLRAMDKNKESLKVKLMLRRPINQLVAQGIMPPLKTSPAFHEQRQKLERAKMGDLLKAKIQQRPDRQELVRQHILEADMTHIDPSLAERQRMLKKARLVDALNDQLSHRPGPLELIKKNILHTDEPIERAVKEGVIPFKATCEGQLTKPQHPNHYITYDEDSQSSEGAQSPLQPPTLPLAALPEPRQDVLEAAAASAGIVTVALTIPTTGGSIVVTSTSPAAFHQRNTTQMTFADLCNSVARSISPPSHLPTILPLAPAPSPMSLGSTTSSLSPLSSISVSSPTGPPTPSPTISITPRPLPQPSPSPNRDAPGKDKNRKKSKSKSQPKTRTIKFHEYKGPPNAHKAMPISASSVETSYEILLHQQQLFLQWQLEWQHKYPQIILPAVQKPLSVSTESGNSSMASFVQVGSPAGQHAGLSVASSVPSPGSVAMSPAASAMMQPMTPQQVAVMSPVEPPQQQQQQQQQQQHHQQVVRTLTKLEDMKVSDLKAELKRRNLPVSGPKPQLIERLKPFTELITQASQHDGINNQTTIPVSQMGHIIMDIPGSVMSEESLSGMSSMETPGSPLHQHVNHAVEGSITDDNESVANLSPASQQQLSPVSQTMSPEGIDLDMDTSESSMMASGSSPLGSPPPASPMQSVIGEDIILNQQRRIKELQRELHRSQQQLQQIRHNKESSGTQPRLKQATVTTLPNGVVIDTKQHQKLVLQQHLQNKIQTQQLQMQLTQLQQLQTLQQQQQVQQQQRQQQHVAFQQQQKQIQQGINAKASLAAFLQSQSQQQQLSNLIQQQQQQQQIQQAAAANNKNNNNSVNNKKNGVIKNIVLGHQQAAIVLNQLNAQQKQKANGLNGITVTGHQRTTSLPNFFGSFVTTQQASPPTQPAETEDVKVPLVRGNTEPQFLVVKPPPPQYEEATKQLKVKLEVPSPCAGGAENKTKQKNVKSQIVDDVLEILIKNGELPASAAQDPATPTTPGRSLPQGLIFTAAPPAPASPPAPPPPPPPPLPHTTFAITLPTAITLTTQAETNETPFQLQFTNADSLDFILGNVSGRTNENPNLLLDMQSNPAIDLKELGLDLETLDTMDFGQLDCSDLGVNTVKMEPSELMVTEMEVSEQNTDRAKHEESLRDQLINQQQCELMDIEMPMDMDDSDWLESLMPTNGPGPLSSSSMTPPHQITFLPQSNPGGFNFNQHVDIDTYDPLLSNSQDPFDLFNIEDSEFKMSGDLNSALGWDKVDFAT